MSTQKNTKIKAMLLDNFVNDDELDLIKRMAIKFGFTIHLTWSDVITHLVVKTFSTNICLRTPNFANALLFDRCIVNLEWVKESFSRESLQLEKMYMPFDASGESSPLTCWKIRQGIIASTMNWAKNYILYFHSSIAFNDLYSNITIWAEKIGFTVTNNLEDLKKNECKIKIILVYKPQIPIDNVEMPLLSDIIGWIFRYNATTLFLDWFFECLFRYRFVEINDFKLRCN